MINAANCCGEGWGGVQRLLTNFCAKSFVVTKPILQLHHIVDNPLFFVLFLFILLCGSFPVHRSIRECVGGKLPRHRFRRPQAVASGI
jgi:hypothetical protein